MNILNYFLGSFYIINSVFRFSYNYTSYLFESNYIHLPIVKFGKINEIIYSTIHSVLVSITSFISIYNSLVQNEMQYLTVSLCFSYFLIDLLKCIYDRKYIFILHHLAALHLLIYSFYSFHNQENKGYYIMSLIFFLESNTILLNIGFLLKEFKFHYSIVCTSWIIHLFLFVLFRLFILPYIIFLFYYNEKIMFMDIFLLISLSLIFFGSSFWCYKQVKGIHNYLKENCVI
jgi:hypothetical protein